MGRWLTCEIVSAGVVARSGMGSGPISEAEVRGGGSADEDTLARLLGQGAGEGIAIGDATVAIPQELDEFIDMQGAVFVSQYLDG